MDGGLVAVDVGDKLPDAALIAHGLGLDLLPPPVGDGDGQARVQKRLLPHPGVERLVIILRRLGEHLRVWLEDDFRAGLVRLAHHLHGLGDVAAGKLHLVDVPVFIDPDLQPFAQGVHDRGTHAVQAAGDLVAPAAELAAGVQDGKDHLQGGLAGLLLDVHGDAAAVVHDLDDVARLDAHLNVGAVAGQGFVDGVVHDLIDQVVQATGGGGADVHARPFPDRLQSLQDLDLRGPVFMFHRGGVFVFQLIHVKPPSFVTR